MNKKNVLEKTKTKNLNCSLRSNLMNRFYTRLRTRELSSTTKGSCVRRKMPNSKFHLSNKPNQQTKTKEKKQKINRTSK